MATETFPEPSEERLRWAIREGFLIAGIFLFWFGAGLVFLVALGIVAFVIQTFQITQLRFVYDILRWDSVVWSAVMTLASATTGLYILVRTGTVLIDRYQSSASA